MPSPGGSSGRSGVVNIVWQLVFLLLWLVRWLLLGRLVIEMVASVRADLAAGRHLRGGHGTALHGHRPTGEAVPQADPDRQVRRGRVRPQHYGSADRRADPACLSSRDWPWPACDMSRLRRVMMQHGAGLPDYARPFTFHEGVAMRLTPADVHNVAFKKPSIGKRGYDEDEVDAFLDLVEAELSNLIEENNELTQRLSTYEAGGTPPTPTRSRCTTRSSRLQPGEPALAQRAEAAESVGGPGAVRRQSRPGRRTPMPSRDRRAAAASRARRAARRSLPNRWPHRLRWPRRRPRAITSRPPGCSDWPRRPPIGSPLRLAERRRTSRSSARAEAESLLSNASPNPTACCHESKNQSESQLPRPRRRRGGGAGQPDQGRGDGPRGPAQVHRDHDAAHRAAHHPGEEDR